MFLAPTCDLFCGNASHSKRLLQKYVVQQSSMTLQCVDIYCTQIDNKTESVPIGLLTNRRVNKRKITETVTVRTEIEKETT